RGMAQDPRRIFFELFSCPQDCPQKVAGYPHFLAVFHRAIHKSSTSYQALSGRTLSCWQAEMPYSTGFPIRFPVASGVLSEILRGIRRAFPTAAATAPVPTPAPAPARPGG